MAAAASPSPVHVVNLPPEARAGAEKAGLARPANPALGPGAEPGAPSLTRRRLIGKMRKISHMIPEVHAFL